MGQVHLWRAVRALQQVPATQRGAVAPALKGLLEGLLQVLELLWVWDRLLRLRSGPCRARPSSLTMIVAIPDLPLELRILRPCIPEEQRARPNGDEGEEQLHAGQHQGRRHLPEVP